MGLISQKVDLKKSRPKENDMRFFDFGCAFDQNDT